MVKSRAEAVSKVKPKGEERVVEDQMLSGDGGGDT